MPAEKLSRRVRRTYTDLDSGEEKTLEHEEPLKRRPPRDTRSTEPFTMCFPDGMRVLAQLPLTQTAGRVLMQLVSIMGFEESFTASPTEIGVALGMDRFQVGHALAELRKFGILVAMPGRKVLIHPDYWWRGSLLSRIRMLKELDKNRAADAAKPDRNARAPSRSLFEDVSRETSQPPTEGEP